MKLRVRSQISYTGNAPCTFVFNVAAARAPGQAITSESMTTDFEAFNEAFPPDHLGNRLARCHLPQGGELTLNYDATVALSHVTADPATLTEATPATLPPAVFPYLPPSRYCESDEIIKLAHDEFGQTPPGFGRVLAICDWITDKVRYTPGSTDSGTSALDTLTEREGVCRDFAHLGIALCRALDIPARFVSVYAHELVPQDFHAIFEAYLGNRWWLFDATRMAALDRVVRIGTGRDAADVPFATLWGPALMTGQTVTVDRTDGLSQAWDGSPVSMIDR